MKGNLIFGDVETHKNDSNAPEKNDMTVTKNNPVIIPVSRDEIHFGILRPP